VALVRGDQLRSKRLAVTRSLKLHLGPTSVMTVLLTVTVASVARLPAGEVMVDLSAHGLMPR
jgi:hypothetical protein